MIVEKGIWVTPTHEAAGLDWQVVDITRRTVFLRWTDPSFDVRERRIEPIDGFWDRFRQIPIERKGD